jgi:hypothetical protein
VRFHLGKVDEEVRIVTVVEREKIFLDVGELVENFLNLSTFNELVTEFIAIQTSHRCVDGIADEGGKVHQLVAGEVKNWAAALKSRMATE